MNYDELKKLDELRKNGILTEEEFQKEKEKFFRKTKSFQTIPIKPATQPKGSNYYVPSTKSPVLEWELIVILILLIIVVGLAIYVAIFGSLIPVG